LELPLSARILEGGNVLVATAVEHAERALMLAQTGAEVLVLPDESGKVDLPGLMQELGRREMNEVLVESGNRLTGALLRAGLVDELIVYLAPHLLGDTARGMFDLQELVGLDQRIDLTVRDIRRIGEDLRIVARIRT
jgi:diaminohydroxyphosphoribosylaminopyrimidine deaminase/5-amino-6-(5-phosphoribosylamino)uracil reductase